jgi:transposase
MIGKCFERHRHQEFRRFLRMIDTQVPRSLQIHMIVDNYGTHTRPEVKAWLAKRTRRAESAIRPSGIVDDCIHDRRYR